MAAEKTTIHVDGKNNQFIVSLPSNPTTGFQWTVEQYDKQFLQIKEQHYQTHEINRVGSGGEMVFTFSRCKGALYPKSTIIIFRYARSWESALSGVTKAVIINFK